MKSTSMKSLFLFAASMGAIAIASAACSGGGGGSNPTPTPTATPANECDIVFVSANAANASNIDAYVVNMPATEWANGTKTITLGASGGDPTVDATYPFFLYNYNAGSYDIAGVATSGSFTLGGIPATDPLAQGATFTFTATDNLKFFDLFGSSATGAQVGSNGAGSIASGTLSDPAAFASGSSVQVTPVDGSVTVRVNNMTVNSNLTIGGTGSAYAGCYYYSAFAPSSPAQHAAQVVDRVLRSAKR